MTKETTLIYKNNYINLSRKELIDEIKQKLSKKRFDHVLRVEEVALKLARKYEADIEKVSIAALLHDIAKEENDEEMRDLIISENLNLNLLQYGSEVWHGPVGAIIAKREFYIKNEVILDSISQHTVGARDMTLTAQIVFVADYIEEGRTFPKVAKARKLAEESLEKAVKYKLKETIRYLLGIEEKIYPETIETYNSWIEK